MKEIFEILTYDHTKVGEGTPTGVIDISTDYPDFTPVAAVLTPDRPQGLYEVSFSLTWNLATVKKSGIARWSEDGGNTWYEIQSEPKDKTNDNTSFYGYPFEHTGGPIDIQVEITREAGTSDMQVRFCDIIIQRVQ